jgi:DNA-binding response OmpR family regulator
MGTRWRVDRDNVIIGREEDCDIVLPSRQVSRNHARIRRSGGRHILEDLGSKNGTFVNGQELTEPYILQDGDEIQVALSFRLFFVDAGATVPLFFERQVGLRLDKDAKSVWIKGRELDPPLSLAQYRLLELLYDNEGRVRSRDEVVQAVWPDAVEEGVSEQAIDALARRLRERLSELDPDHQYIVTVRGHGFRFDNFR